jgi:hypothetical protein
MGCCESSPAIDDFSLSSVTPVERMTFEHIISQIPVHCRQEIINLPVQPFLRIYQYHLEAIWFIARNEFHLAMLRELQAIEGLRTLLSHCKDHFIFSDFYTILSASFIRSGNVESAIETAQISLIILVKHTPTDHKNISVTYATLALYHRLAKESRAAELCAMKAIERARLTNELSQQDISTLEEILELTK